MIKFQFLLDRKYLNTEKRHLIHILISIYHLASSEKKSTNRPSLVFIHFWQSYHLKGGENYPSNDPNSLRLIHTLIRGSPEKTKFQSIPETRNQPNQQESIPVVVVSVRQFSTLYSIFRRNQPCQETSCRRSRRGNG